MRYVVKTQRKKREPRLSVIGSQKRKKKNGEKRYVETVCQKIKNKNGEKRYVEQPSNGETVCVVFFIFSFSVFFIDFILFNFLKEKKYFSKEEEINALFEACDLFDNIMDFINQYRTDIVKMKLLYTVLNEKLCDIFEICKNNKQFCVLFSCFIRIISFFIRFLKISLL